MSKYHRDLDLDSENDSMVLVYQMVTNGSRVLEFGAATGYLTQHLSEEKGCQVSIIEIDQSGYNQAIKFAVDGVLGDIECYDWKDKWKEKTFDFILFGDVLEHLRNPAEVMRVIKPLMAPGGKVIITVPNAAHNSIIFNLLKNEFRYNNLGLLDNTHIHLFTYNSVCNMLMENGWHIVKEQATYCEDPFYLNEFKYSLNEADLFEQRVLADHIYGNVYQFVFTAMLEELEKVNAFKSIIDERRILKVYYDTGDGFIENQVIESSMRFGDNTLEHIIDNIGIIKNIRIDFGKDNFQYIQLHEITWNDKKIANSLIEGNYGYRQKNNYFFNSENASIYFPVTEGNKFKISFYQEKLESLGLEVPKLIDGLIAEYKKMQRVEQTLSSSLTFNTSDLDAVLETLIVDHKRLDKIKQSFKNPIWGMSLIIKKIKRIITD